MTQLSGKDLDIAVGLANGWTIKPDEFNSGRWILPDGSQGMLVDVYRPSELWMHGGPLIEDTGITLLYWGDQGKPFPWEAQKGGEGHYIDQYPEDAIGGNTALEAACRAYVEIKGQPE